MVKPFSSDMFTLASPFAKPAAPPFPSPFNFKLFSNIRSESVTCPLNVAFTGPTFWTTVASKPFSGSPVISLHPGIHFNRTSGDIKAFQTVALSVLISLLSFSSINCILLFQKIFVYLIDWLLFLF